MHGGLFVAHEDVVQCLFVVIECIVGGHDGTARVAEEYFHPFMLQRSHQCLCTSYLFHCIFFFVA